MNELVSPAAALQSPIFNKTGAIQIKPHPELAGSAVRTGCTVTSPQQEEGEREAISPEVEEQKKDYASLPMTFSHYNGNSERHSLDDISDMSEQEELNEKGKESFTTRSSRGKKTINNLKRTKGVEC